MPNHQRFNIFTGLLKAYEGPNGEKRFRTTASSTITDLAGDEIVAEAIEKMAAKAQNNLTIFLNHEYRVPEDVLGSVEATSMQTRGVDTNGSPIVDLDFDVKLNDSNPRALQTFEAIKSGVRLGTSIGAIVRHAEKKKGGGLRIDDLELLEASIVGIPANPRSWVQYAAKSLAKAEFEFEEAVIEDEKVADAEVETTDVQPDLTNAMCPACGKAKGESGCSDDYHGKSAEPEAEKEAEPEVTEAEPDKEAARTRVTVTVDSEGTQEAPKSTPEPALLDETADEDDASLGDTVTQAIDPDKTAELSPEESTDLAAIVKRFSEIATSYGDLQKKHDALVAKNTETEENLAVARQIIEKIADLPIGRKTTFKGAVDDFRVRFPQYDNEFHKFLEK